MRARWFTIVCLIGCGSFALQASAHEPGMRARHGAALPAAPLSLHESEQTLDPFMRAVVIAMAARILREAAASPDPLAALAESVGHHAQAALASPEAMRLVEAFAGQALRDVPEDLRQALTSFALSVAAQMRREMLYGRRSTP
jgi:hypothetical protein